MTVPFATRILGAMEPLADALPWIGVVFLMAGLLALVFEAGTRTVLGAFLPGVALLGFQGARQWDVLLVAGLFLAGLAAIVALVRPENPAENETRPPNTNAPPETPGRTEPPGPPR
ncbi:hypothetical protein JCM15519_35930 [Fundidesulfovibrio butyratiphilus]